jgi:integrase
MSVGLRLGEALGLRWSDVGLNARELHVRQALQRIEGKLQVVEPTSERSRRIIALPEMAVKVRKRPRNRQRKERLKAGSWWNQGGLVFTSTVGTVLDERNVRKGFKAILREAKLPTIRIHDLRHTCVSLLLAQDVNPRVVMETLGHS